MKKIIILVVSLMLILGCVFGFVGYKKAYAETYPPGWEFGYTGEVSTSASNIPDYAITDIESISYSSSIDFIFNVTMRTDTYFFRFADIPNGGFSASQSLGYAPTCQLSFDDDDVNFSTSSYNAYLYSVSIEGVNNAHVSAWTQSSTAFGVHGTAGNSYIVKFTFNFDRFVNSSDELDFFTDMTSSSSYYSLGYGFQDTSIFSLFSNYVFNKVPLPNNSTYGLVNVDLMFMGGTRVYAVEGKTCNFRYDYGLVNTLTNYDCVSNINYLEFSIYRPTERINNTLVLYNYNYGFLSGVDSVHYSLRLGDYLYGVHVGGEPGLIPNENFIYIYNAELNNRVFDEYIVLEFDGTSSMSYMNYGFSTMKYDDETRNLMIDFGFDFNFTFYNQPLVASNGSYNFNFTKPGYVSMPFSLNPFYIPVLEAVQNIFIFLIFYCPIISDILALLNLDLFIGGLVSVLNFIVGLQIGQFLIGCISFIIFFVLLKSFMPVAFSSSSEEAFKPIKIKKDRKFKSGQQKDLNSTNWKSPFDKKK